MEPERAAVLAWLPNGSDGAGKLSHKHRPAEVATPEMAFEASVEKKTKAMIPAAIEQLDQRFAAGEVSQEVDKSQFAVLTEQLKG